MPSLVLDLPRLRPDQYKIVMHPAKIKVLAAGRRWGKSLTIGTTELAAASQGAKAGWGVPNYRNAAPVWRWAIQAVADLVEAKVATINRADRLIEFPQSGGRLGIYTLDNFDSIRGEAFHIFAVDEAARVAEEAWTDVIQPTLADYDGQAFLISSPKGRNWFWREYQEGLKDGEYIASFTAPTSDNPIASIRRAAELARLRVPDRTYRQEWLAEFVDDSLTLFSRDWYDDQNRYNPLELRHANTTVGRWISWDTAIKDTEDSAFSAAVVGDLMPDYTMQIREVYRDRLNFPSLIAQITRLAYQYNQDGMLRGIVIEDRVSGTSAYQTISSAADPWLARLVVPFMPSGSKTQRAAQAGVWCQNGSVQLPHPMVKPDGEPACPWLWSFEDELFSAPKSLYMDQVDAFSQLILWTENLLREGLDARRAAYGDPYEDLIRAVA